MNWQQIREQYPQQWLVVEAIEAHTEIDGNRIADRLEVIEQCPNGASAIGKYRQLHGKHPEKEYYYLHTSREKLEILEETWLGIRMSSGTSI